MRVNRARQREPQTTEILVLPAPAACAVAARVRTRVGRQRASSQATARTRTTTSAASSRRRWTRGSRSDAACGARAGRRDTRARPAARAISRPRGSTSSSARSYGRTCSARRRPCGRRRRRTTGAYAIHLRRTGPAPPRRARAAARSNSGTRAAPRDLAAYLLAAHGRQQAGGGLSCPLRACTPGGLLDAVRGAAGPGRSCGTTEARRDVGDVDRRAVAPYRRRRDARKRAAAAAHRVGGAAPRKRRARVAKDLGADSGLAVVHNGTARRCAATPGSCRRTTRWAALHQTRGAKRPGAAHAARDGGAPVRRRERRRRSPRRFTGTERAGVPRLCAPPPRAGFNTSGSSCARRGASSAATPRPRAREGAAVGRRRCVPRAPTA